jgi:hypothetical protein
LNATGGKLVTFSAAAAGPTDATPGLAFTNGYGFTVSLSQAQLYVSSTYLVQSQANSGAGPTSCILQGVYTGQVLQPLTVDLLNPSPQPFGGGGTGTNTPSLTGQVWQVHGDVNVADTTPVFTAMGSASKGGVTCNFAVSVANADWIVPGPNPAEPNAVPICARQIVSPISVDITLEEGGTLLLRVDPRLIFQNVDFSELMQAGACVAPTFVFPDNANDTPSQSLFDGLRSRATYSFTWEPAP